MAKRARKTCPGCQQLQRQVAALQTQVHSLSTEVVHLREQLASAQKNSATSSKPPSSDLVKPSAPHDDASTRPPGGQPGHPMHQREPFTLEQLTHIENHTLQNCPRCGEALTSKGHPGRVVQQVDIQQPPLLIQQHTSLEYWCHHCQRPVAAPLPVSIERGGLVGPRLTALIAYLKGVCHASFSTIRKFLRDVAQIPISRGHLSKILSKVSAALEGPYAELLECLPDEAFLNVDETGHKCNGEPWWTWCFRAALYTLYHIDAHRSADVLLATLGKDFDGVLGCDYFSSYRRYMRLCSIQVQFCLAHLIRDVKFLTTLPDARDRAYGERLRLALKELFAVFHQRKDMPATLVEARLEGARRQVLRAGLEEVPPTRHAQNLAKRFRDHGASYFTFVTTPGVEPTNNLAEQAIRFVVIDRHITQGTRSASGRSWSERIWTVIATCEQQGRSVWEYLTEALEKWFNKQPAPSLLSGQPLR
jgi:transposase